MGSRQSEEAISSPEPQCHHFSRKKIVVRRSSEDFKIVKNKDEIQSFNFLYNKILCSLPSARKTLL